MSNIENIFGEMTVQDILVRIASIVNQTSYISEVADALKSMGDGDSGDSCSPGNLLGQAKAEALGAIVTTREATNQQILKLYEKNVR